MERIDGEIKKGFVEKFRIYKSKKYKLLGQFFVNLGVTANMMTFVSLLLGITAVYFLFTNYFLFFFFAALHVLADGLDGVIARESKVTRFGKYFDHISDRFITLLLLLKIGWFLNDYYAYLVIGLFVLAQAVHLLSRFESPILFTRTLTLILLVFFTFPFVPLPFVNILLTLTYLTTGVAAMYSLARQLQWFLGRAGKVKLK